jgi:hypothetical protein
MVLAGLAAPARADVIYSNLGPGESYGVTNGWVEWGPDFPLGPSRTAFAFTVTADTLFDSARLALGLVSGPRTVDLRLYDAVGVFPRPRNLLETIHSSTPPPDSGEFNSGPLVVFDSTLHPLLQAGHTYYLLPFVYDNTHVSWLFNFSWRVGTNAYSTQAEPTTWSVAQRIEGAFDVNGTPSPAPEPSTLALAGVGLVGMVGFVWRHRRKPDVA